MGRKKLTLEELYEKEDLESEKRLTKAYLKRQKQQKAKMAKPYIMKPCKGNNLH
jgi:hypothetical protein